MPEIKYMDVKEFRELGFLQELNRCFLHPLGLALEVAIEEDGTEHLGRIWDCRDDPEGIIFGEISTEKFEQVRNLWNEKREVRYANFDYMVQHVDGNMNYLEDSGYE